VARAGIQLSVAMDLHRQGLTVSAIPCAIPEVISAPSRDPSRLPGTRSRAGQKPCGSRSIIIRAQGGLVSVWLPPVSGTLWREQA